MGVIHRSKRTKFRVMYSEKTVYPVPRHLGAKDAGTNYEPGEFLGIKSTPGMNTVCEKVTAANQYAQAKNAAMRVNTTTNDVLESGAITVNDGGYQLKTEFYLAGTYGVGDKLTLRYDADRDLGVLGPVDGSTTDLIAQVVSPPQNGDSLTPMIVKIYQTPIPYSA